MLWAALFALQLPLTSLTQVCIHPDCITAADVALGYTSDTCYADSVDSLDDCTADELAALAREAARGIRMYRKAPARAAVVGDRLLRARTALHTSAAPGSTCHPPLL